MITGSASPSPPSERRNDASVSVSASSADPTTALSASARSGFTLAANRAPEAKGKHRRRWLMRHDDKQERRIRKAARELPIIGRRERV